jgi:hypothetical protein
MSLHHGKGAETTVTKEEMDDDRTSLSDGFFIGTAFSYPHSCLHRSVSCPAERQD